jgi:hypothetical protein
LRYRHQCRLKLGDVRCEVSVKALRVEKETGWSPDNVRMEVAAREQLHAIEVNAEAFVGGLDDPMASGGPILCPMAQPWPVFATALNWTTDESGGSGRP